MPVQYTSIIDEHNAVRQHSGVFDTSHMGIFIVSGEKCAEFLNKMTVSNIPVLVPGKAKYTLLLNKDGGIIDDLIVYRRKNDFLIVANAGNTEKDFDWLNKNLIKGANLENIGRTICLFALQGPDSERVLQPLTAENLKELKYFNFMESVSMSIGSGSYMIARTGYTGEDGFEIFASLENAPGLWDKLISLGVKPCGLGCRDTLRLEACMPLHGHEITDNTTPIVAGIDWTIFWDKEFIGKEVLLSQKQKGISSTLAAFVMESGIPRANCDIIIDGNHSGKVTSGTFSPTLKKGIGLGYVKEPLEIGRKIEILVHNQRRVALVVKKPFYKRHR